MATVKAVATIHGAKGVIHRPGSELTLSDADAATLVKEGAAVHVETAPKETARGGKSK